MYDQRTSPVVAAGGSFPSVVSDCVKQAAVETIGTMCGLQAAYQGDARHKEPFDGVFGLISFVGDVGWSLMLAVPRQMAPVLARKFAGFDIPYDSADMGDVIGEMANVLAGDISSRLDRRGLRAQISLPTVARGSDVELLSQEGQASMRMRFSTREGDYWLMLATAPDHAHHHR